MPHELLTTNADDVVNDPEISIVVEFMGGEQPATDYMLRALENGKTVVTANKVAIALNWHRLQAAAQRNHVGLYYEASVCGAIPIINTLMQPLQANRIDSLMGIINGTTNYILSRMYENGEDYEAVLKLLAIAKRSGNTIEVRVHPTLIANDHPLSQVNGSFNAVYLHGHACKEMMLQGRGAGDLPTASAVVGDILHAATVDVHVHPTFVNSANADASLVFTNDWKTRHFLRLSIQDEPGSLAKIATWLSSEQVSIATMMQKAELAGSRVPLIIITHEANEQAIRAALAKFDPEVCTVENMIRVE